MLENQMPPAEQDGPSIQVTSLRSLKELIDLVSGKNLKETASLGDSGLAEHLPFPFLAMVGQHEMKLALILGLINPALGGILLIGPRGTGKTTAVRSLLDLLPSVNRSACFYGCLPEDIDAGGIDAICPDCAKKFAEGKSLTITDQVRLVELPLNATMENVVGGLDELAKGHERMRFKRGILAQADKNILYVDEVNLLGDDIVDAILDASAQGMYTVRRGPLFATYRSRFILSGSMNPEEGRLRPQILDRFGLRVIVKGLDGANDRLEVYRRVQRYLTNPRLVINEYSQETDLARIEIQEARNLLPQVILSTEIATKGIKMVQEMHITSLRAEITMFEAARALAAADRRNEVTITDLREVAPMALRLRRSTFMVEYFSQQANEETELLDMLNQTMPLE